MDPERHSDDRRPGETVSQAILKASIELRVFGNGLMNVHIFHKLLGNSISVVQGYLNVDGDAVLELGTSAPQTVSRVSVRHFFPEGVTDPTYFTEQLMAKNLSNTHEPMFDVVQDASGAEAEAEREFFFQKLMETNSSDAYWRLTNQRCIDVYHRVVAILGLNPTDPRYKLPSNKIPVNEVCPCGSSKKYKKCHVSKTIY
jgi:hypothetical protein